MSAYAYVDVGGMRRYIPVEWCELCGMSMPADHETFRHADNPHLYPAQAGAPGRCVAEGSHYVANDPTKESKAMSNPIDDRDREGFIVNLRVLADLLEHIPEIPVYDRQLISFHLGLEAFEEIATVAAALDAAEVTYSRRPGNGSERLVIPVGTLRYEMTTLTADQWTHYKERHPEAP